jgi:hypothetical protein
MINRRDTENAEKGKIWKHRRMEIDKGKKETRNLGERKSKPEIRMNARKSKPEKEPLKNIHE